MNTSDWQMPAAPNRTPLQGDSTAMLTGWGELSTTVTSAHPTTLTAARRSRLASVFPGETLVIPAGILRVRTNDSDYPFRPGTDHVWLTGNLVAESVLVIKTVGGRADSELFLRPGSGRTNDVFWQDGTRGDLWVGRRPSLVESQDAFEIPCRPLDQLESALLGRQLRVVPTLDPVVDGLAQRGGTDFTFHLALKAELDRLRLVKDYWEISQLRFAADVAIRGFEDVAEDWQNAIIWGERYVEGTFARRSRVEGEGPAYPPVVGGGSHAATLHWIDNSGPLRMGDLALLDMGVELRSLYASDVTRTLPVSGRYNSIQRTLYEIVLRSQQAGIEALQSGARFQDYQDACSRSLCVDLVEIGLLRVSAEEAFERHLFRRWMMSRAGHMLGMDVHDCNHSPQSAYLLGDLLAGHVLTVEPGLYFQEEDETVPSEFRGVGIRIEDDLLVTEEGSENLTAALPRDPDAVESWMAASTELGHDSSRHS